MQNPDCKPTDKSNDSIIMTRRGVVIFGGGSLLAAVPIAASIYTLMQAPFTAGKGVEHCSVATEGDLVSILKEKCNTGQKTLFIHMEDDETISSESIVNALNSFFRDRTRDNEISIIILFHTESGEFSANAQNTSAKVQQEAWPTLANVDVQFAPRKRAATPEAESPAS